MCSSQCHSWHVLATWQLLLLIAASRFFPPPSAGSSPPRGSRAEWLLGRAVGKGRATLWPLRQGKRCPKRTGHFPRQGAQAVGASCPFAQRWLQEFLDPLPEECAGCPLEVPREGSGSPRSARFQLLEHALVRDAKRSSVGGPLPNQCSPPAAGQGLAHPLPAQEFILNLRDGKGLEES